MSQKTVKPHHIFQGDVLPLRAQFFPKVAVSHRNHQHDFHELIIILRGTGIHNIDGVDYPIKAGDVYLIKDEMAHGFRKMNGVQLVNVYFLPDSLDMPMLDLRELAGYHALFELEPMSRARDGFKSHLTLDDAQLAEAKRHLDAMIEEQENREPGHRFTRLSRFQCLIGFLSRCYSNSPSRAANSLLRISGALTHIERHYDDENLDFAILSKKANMSRSAFLRAFKMVTGHSPIDHLIRTRIAKAREKLLETDAKIYEIAFEVGFADSNYFTRKFTELNGVSPRKYRQSR